MALAKKQSNTSRLLAWLIVAVALGGIIYLIIQKVYVNPSSNGGQIVNHATPPLTNFGESIFTDPRYTTLREFSTPLNVNLDQAGQPQPFN